MSGQHFVERSHWRLEFIIFVKISSFSSCMLLYEDRGCRAIQYRAIVSYAIHSFIMNLVVIYTSHVRIAFSPFTWMHTHRIMTQARSATHTCAISRTIANTLCEYTTWQLIFSNLPMARRCRRLGRKVLNACKVYSYAILNRLITEVESHGNAYGSD